jgi:hypothetical protein
MSIDWKSLRSLGNSQNHAFEELCCQLASSEPVKAGATFIRKGAPDAGIECLWRLSDGSEWGWQAKFFQRLEAAQWAQLDKSVRTAINKHPQLTSYTICLPIDRQDPRIEGRVDPMDQWNDRVARWQGWCRDKGMSVKFKYWGEHELWERLSTDEHRGRHYFWFNKESFTSQWFKARLEEAIANAGARYTPEINVGLPIADLFDGLGRTASFRTKLTNAGGALKIAYARLRFGSEQEQINPMISAIRNSAELLFPLLENISAIRPINFDGIRRLALEINKSSWEANRILDETRTRSLDPGDKSANKQPDVSYGRHLLSELANRSIELTNLVSSSECRLANTPALALVGNAGTGKTHLLCDVARKRVEAGLPSVLLLGENFSSEEPWSQIIRMLGLTCDRSEFLGALEAAAQAAGAKVLILIDALNEGDGKTLWHRYLAGMLTTLSRYPWIGLAVTVRSAYEDLVIPEALLPEKMIREEHPGFAEHEYKATETFFEFYKLKTPSVPLLNPEFENPLFLKLFCKSLNNLGRTEVPAGLQGVTAIFDLFIESVNEKLARPDALDLDASERIVQKAVDHLVDAMTVTGKTWLPREEAKNLINGLLPPAGFEKSLFRNLSSEGVIAEDRFWDESQDQKWIDSIHFAYERLSDHLITKRLLAKHFDVSSPSRAFEPEQPLGEYVNDQIEAWRNRGVIEALAIQLPELYSSELFDCAPQCANCTPSLEAFIDSVIWRRPESFSDATLKHINNYIIESPELHHQFLDALLTVSSNVEHPYNAEFLHKNLISLELPERDSWWSIYLHERYTHSEIGPLSRLLDWAWSAADKSHIDDKSLALASIALAWFFTTSNRFVRDRATKALVALLTPRINVLGKVLERFREVNDPYVSERIYAVAYGCAMRSTDLDAIKQLALRVYRLIFEGGNPPVHILLRDYARGVIEVALHCGIELEIDVAKVRPPYGSDWIGDLPSKEELEKRYNTWEGQRSDQEIAQSEIFHSVMGSEDFARYVIGTNSGHFDWTSRRLEDASQPMRKEIFEQFVESLTRRQKEVFDRLSAAYDKFDRFLRMDEEKRRESFHPDLTEEIFRSILADLEKDVRKRLRAPKRGIFDKHIIPCLKDPFRCRYENNFSLSVAQRWILQRVFDLGWTKERFGDFDLHVNRYTNDYRTGHKPERIGKKYQWIAFHEFLARVADNFEYKSSDWIDGRELYNGPWQPSERDIDPSCLLRETGREVWKHRTQTWWFPVCYEDWGSEWSGGAADNTWLKGVDDLPPVESLIETVNPNDGSHWLTLNAYYNWEQPVPTGVDPSDTRRKQFWYILHSYLVRKRDARAFFEWACQQDFFGKWMPETHALYEVFLGEFFWSPAYAHFNVPYHGRQGWTRGHGRKIPRRVLVSADEYTQESQGFDCSIDESYSIYLPAKWIADGMSLSWKGKGGHCCDPSGELVAFDPSVTSKGPSALLLRKDKFLKFLHESKCEIVWTVIGEKSDYNYGSHGSDHSGRL